MDLSMNWLLYSPLSALVIVSAALVFFIVVVSCCMRNLSRPIHAPDLTQLHELMDPELPDDIAVPHLQRLAEREPDFNLLLSIEREIQRRTSR